MSNFVVLIFQPNQPNETLMQVFENIPDACDRASRRLCDGVLLLSEHSALFDLSVCHHVFAQSCTWIYEHDRGYVAMHSSALSISQWALVGTSLRETKASLKKFLDQAACSGQKDHG